MLVIDGIQVESNLESQSANEPQTFIWNLRRHLGHEYSGCSGSESGNVLEQVET